MRPFISHAGASQLARSRLVLALLVGASLCWLTTAQNPAATPPSPAAVEYYFHHDHVIGTSLDVWVVAAGETAATACERAVLDEIERLRRVFSTYDPESELSKLNRASGPVAASAEMLEVLHAYEAFQERSLGAFNGQLGELIRVWKAAEKTGVEPDAATLARIVEEIRRPGWHIDDARQTVTRLTGQPLDLNSIAKGYIIRQAVAAARREVSALQGLLLNLGGDMFVWSRDVAGRPGLTVGVQDPFRPEDNAPVLTALRLHDQAVAVSGGSERYYTIGGRRYSHLFDPRTGRPAEGVAGATVVAPDSVTANALATTLCVLAPEDGLRLVTATPGAECLLVAADGRQVRSPGFRALERPPPRPARAEAADSGDNARNPADAWPEGYQVNLTVTLPTIAPAGRYRSPYVAVWAENADGKVVRTIAVWGNSSKYLRDLTQWWKLVGDDKDLVYNVARTTRRPGRYTLVWDGADDKGKPVPQGTYTIHVEVHREHGKHVTQTGKIQCGGEAAKATLEKNAETDATEVEYAKKKSP